MQLLSEKFYLYVNLDTNLRKYCAEKWITKKLDIVWMLLCYVHVTDVVAKHWNSLPGGLKMLVILKAQVERVLNNLF